MSTLYGADKTVESLSKAGIYKTCATPGKLFFGGFAAGAYIALGFLFAIMSSAAYYPFKTLPAGVPEAFRHPNPSLFKILLGATFPVGLVAVLIGGADLRTGNVQVPFYAKMTGKADIKKVVYNRVTSYGGNFFGGFFVAYLAIGGALLSSLFGATVADLAYKKASLSFEEAFLRGIGCNRLVNLAVRLYARSEDYAGKFLGIRFPIFAFVTTGFEHSIANMRILTAGVALGSISRVEAFHNLIPVTLGNAVGGFFFIAFYYRYVGNKDVTPRDAAKIIGEFFLATTALMLIDVLPMSAIAYALNGFRRRITALAIVAYLSVASYVSRKALIREKRFLL